MLADATGGFDAQALFALAACITASATLVRELRTKPPARRRARPAKRAPSPVSSDPEPPPATAARRLTPPALTVVFAAVAIVFGMHPAWAHHAELSGSTSCSAGEHVVAWHIENSQRRLPMTITAAEASLNGASWPVSGYTGTVGPAGATDAQTAIPGPLTGDVELTVSASWPDGHVATRSADVELTEPCPTTTTTSSPSSTTSSAPTTTSSGTQPPPSSVGGTSTTAPAATSPTPPLPASSPGPDTPPVLASTGGQVAGAVVLGLAVILLGATLILWARSTPAASTSPTSSPARLEQPPFGDRLGDAIQRPGDRL